MIVKMNDDKENSSRRRLQVIVNAMECTKHGGIIHYLHPSFELASDWLSARHVILLTFYN